MKNCFDLVPGNTDRYRLIPGNTDPYRLIPGHSKHFDLIPADAPQFTLIPTSKASPLRSDNHSRQLSEIRRMGEEARSAVAQLCATFVDTEAQVTRTWRLTQTIRGQDLTGDDEGQQFRIFHKVFTQQFLQQILAVVDTKSNAILAKIGHKS